MYGNIVTGADENMKKTYEKLILFLLMIIIAILMITVGCVISYFSSNCAPMDKNSKEEVVVVIPSGATTKQIGAILKDEEIDPELNMAISRKLKKELDRYIKIVPTISNSVSEIFSFSCNFL